MLKVLKNSFIFSLFFILASCNTSFDSEKELLVWLADVENGFVKKTTANGFSLSMKCLPPEYLAFNEMEKDTKVNQETYKNYINKFNNSRTFLLTLKHEDQSVDASNYNVSSLSEYTERIQELSFNIKNAIVLRTSKGETFYPVLTTMENLYEVGNKKSIYMVFSDNKNEILNSEKLDIVFNDTYLDTGINHFVFDTNEINKLPNLNFIN